MAFIFRLQSVLIYRESLEEKAQLALGKEQRLLEEALKLAEQFRQERLAMISSFEEKKKRAMSSALFVVFQEAILHKEGVILRQDVAIETQRQVVEDKRRELAGRIQDRKVLDHLKEKDHRAYIVEEQAKEQKASDEMAVLRYGR